MTPTPVRHISLDVWNTILKPNPEFAAARAALIAKLTNAPVDEVKRLYTETKRFVDQHAEEYGIGLTTPRVYTILLRDIAKLLNTLDPYPIQIENAQRGVEILFTKMRPEFDWDLVEELERLHKKGYSFSIASNSNFISGEIMGPYLDSKFPHFKFKVFSDLEGVSKPHPKFFKKVLDGMPGHRPQEILHIGDSHECDIVGASFVGMQTKHVFSPSDLVKVLSEI